VNPGSGREQRPSRGPCEQKHALEENGRATAERIQRQRPGWMIVYGCYSRRFVAFALFAMRQRMIVTAAYPDALIARLDDTERRWRLREPQPSSPQPPGSA
jgi:hypothetical protein